MYTQPIKTIANLSSIFTTRAALTAGCALTLALASACAPARATVPSGAHVDVLQTESLVLRGSAEPMLTPATCATTAPSSPQHLLELTDDTAGTMRLRASGATVLKTAMLHVTHLESHRTWCALAQPDGSPAMIPGGFPSGTYAISVSATPGTTAPRYEVVVQRL